MGNPVWFIDNVFSTYLYPDHVLSAEEEATSHEAEMVANGRRNVGDYWTPTTANSDTWIQSVFNRTRACNMLVVEGNLAGEAVTLDFSFDGQTTVETALDLAIPAVTSPGGLDDPLGAVTEDETVWAIRFPTRVGTSVRLNVSAMGSGLAPEIISLWCGMGYECRIFDEPNADEPDDLITTVTMSQYGWEGRGTSVNRRGGSVGLRIRDTVDAMQARLHLRGIYGVGYPGWLFHDADNAQKGYAVIRPEQRISFDYTDAWPNLPRADIPYVEHQARIR